MSRAQNKTQSGGGIRKNNNLQGYQTEPSKEIETPPDSNDPLQEPEILGNSRSLLSTTCNKKQKLPSVNDATIKQVPEEVM